MGSEQQSLPHNQGFDVWYGIPNTSDETFYVPTSQTAQVPLPAGFTQPPIMEAVAGGEAKVVADYDYESRRKIDFEIADRSIAYIEEKAAANDPFFLYVAWTRPHEPNKPSPEFAGKSRIGDYGDGVMELDYNTGRVLKAIDDAGIRDDTIVVWVSDNGPTRTSAWPDAGFAGPFRGELGGPLEGSIRTAGMVRWPGRFTQGVSNEMVSIMDFFPTFAKIIGADMPDARPLDGVDQTAFFEGKQDKSNRDHLLSFAGPDLLAVRWNQFRIYFVEPTPSGTTLNFQYGLGGSHKKLHYPKIFNIEHDPREEYNISGKHAWVMAHASGAVQRYLVTLKDDPNPPAPKLTFD